MLLLSGKTHSGKDAFAAHLRGAHGAHAMAYADALKQQTAQTYSVPIEYFYDERLKDAPIPEEFMALVETPMTPRGLLIKEGARRRALDEACYAKVVNERCAAFIAEHAQSKRTTTGLFVCTDCRFDVEVKQARMLDATKGAAEPGAPLVRVVHAWIEPDFWSDEERERYMSVNDNTIVNPSQCDVIVRNKAPWDGEDMWN